MPINCLHNDLHNYLLFTIGHLTCIFKEGNTKTVKCAKQEKGITTCRKLILKEGDGERRTFYDLQAGFSYSSSVSLFVSLVTYPLVPASVVLVLRVTFFVDQGGRGSFSIRVWVGPGVLGFLRQPPSGKTGVQKYIGCRTRPHGGGSGEGG